MAPGGPDIKAIFTEALEYPAGPEREAYLDRACGDPALRRRVGELLAAYDRASDILGASGAPATSLADAISTEAGASDATGTIEQTGPAPTVDQAPHAGDPDLTTSPDGNGDGLAPGTAVRYFGDYEIRRELGRGGMGVVYEARQVSLNRPVALKMVKAGLLAGDDELRRFQNEAEAVALLDHPGIVPVYEVGQHGGQHYFSMKLVPGGSLVPLIDRYKGEPRAAARLVAEAAEAVAHAHARGILHRDLKPANILVDAEGHPHVTDFGLAKRVEADFELTQSGAILGTPAYMSPEQATGRRGAITTATDVYGLGAVLYAVLTGRAPFGGDSAVETIDAVRNTPPEMPTRVNNGVPRDLETICLKCLEKDPRRRYPTAQALADDLHAWLESRPIAARRVGAAERAWLWCRRKPAVAALSAAVAVTLVGGTATVIAVQAKANADLRAANRRVEQRYELAVEAIKTFHTGVSEDFLLKQAQFKDLRDRLLKSAADFYGKLGALLGKETDVASRRALAQSNFELSELTGKVGRNEDALAAHRAVLAAREALAAEPAAGALAQVDVGRSLIAVAELLYMTGKTDEALATYRRAESLLAGPAGADPSARAALAACRSQMGWLLFATGKSADALAAYRLARADQEALAAAPEASNDARHDLADTIRLIGGLLSRTYKPSEAEAEDRRALAIFQKLADDNPAVTQYRFDLARIHNNLGFLLSDTGKPAEAEAEIRQALAIRQKLADGNPAVTEFRGDLARSHYSLGWALWRTGKAAEAEAGFRNALAIFQKLADGNPAVVGLRSELATSHYALGFLLSNTGKPAEAEAEYRTALALQQKLADDNPTAFLRFRHDLAGSHSNLGFLLSNTGKPAEAEAEYRTALALYQKLADEDPAVTLFRSNVAGSHYMLGVLLSDTGKPAKSEAEYRKALALYQKLADGNPAVTEFHSNLARSHQDLGWALWRTGKLAEAEAELRAALVLFRKLAKDNPAFIFHRNGAANVENDLSVVLRRLGRPVEARDHCERAVAAREALVKEDPKTTRFRSGLAENFVNRGLARRALGDPAGAAADVRRAVALYDALPPRSGEELFLSACAHAALASLAGQASAGVSAAEGSNAADAAMALLHRAVGLGYRTLDAYRTEDALDALRGRADFQLLMMDLAFPAEPFGRVG